MGRALRGDFDFLYLKEKGINFERTDYNGMTPLFRAISRNHWELAFALMDSGARTSYEFKLTDRRTMERLNFGEVHALHHAAEFNSTRVCARLMGAGDPVDLENPIGMTPLSYAAMAGSMEAASTLLDLDADANHDSGPLKFAIIKGHLDLRDLHLEWSQHSGVLCEIPQSWILNTKDAASADHGG